MVIDKGDQGVELGTIENKSSQWLGWGFSGRSRPLDAGRGGSHPNPEVRGGGLEKNVFGPNGPQFALKIRGEEGGHLPWICHWD